MVTAVPPNVPWLRSWAHHPPGVRCWTSPVQGIRATESRGEGDDFCGFHSDGQGADDTVSGRRPTELNRHASPGKQLNGWPGVVRCKDLASSVHESTDRGKNLTLHLQGIQV